MLKPSICAVCSFDQVELRRLLDSCASDSAEAASGGFGKLLE
jgi:hypothetical protein